MVSGIPEALAIQDDVLPERIVLDPVPVARVAVFIDVPSLWASARDGDGVPFDPGALLDAVSRLGPVVSARAYTPATAGRVLRPGVVDLVLVALTADSQFVMAATKDGRVDGVLTADLLAAAREDVADTFVLATANPGYAHALHALRRLRKRVVVVSLGPIGPLEILADELVLLAAG